MQENKTGKAASVDPLVIRINERLDRVLANAEKLEAEKRDLIACLRELVDFSVNDPHYRSKEQSEMARAAAYVMLKRFDG